MIENIKKKGLVAGSMVAGLAFLATVTCAQADTVYTYTFSNGASYDSASGDTADLSGTFSWDSTSGAVSASNITLTGIDLSGTDPAPVNCSNCSTGGYDNSGARYFTIHSGAQALSIIFANPLSNGATDPLALSAYSGANQAQWAGGTTFANAYGSATVSGMVSSVPLPASLPLLASGLIGLGVFARRRRNRA